MQSAITTQIEKVQTSLNFLSGRVDRLEGNLSDTAERQSSRHRANFRYFSRTRAPSIVLMNKLIRPVVQCGPTSLPRSSQHRRFGSLVFAQVQAIDFGLFHSVEFSHMLYVVVMVQPGTWGTTFLFSRWCHFQLPARILQKPWSHTEKNLLFTLQ